MKEMDEFLAGLRKKNGYTLRDIHDRDGNDIIAQKS